MDRSVSDRQDTPNNRLSELMEKAHSRGEVNAEDPSEKAQAAAEVDAEAKAEAEETSRRGSSTGTHVRSKDTTSTSPVKSRNRT